MGDIKVQGIKNSILSYFGIVIGFINILFIQPKFLLPEEIGLVRVLFSISSLVSVIIPLGIVNITMKFFPYFRDSENRHNGYFGFSLIFPFIGLFFTWICLYFSKSIFVDLFSQKSQLLIEFYDYIYLFSFFLGLVSVLSIYCYSLFKTVFPSLINDVLVRVLAIFLILLYYLKLVSFQNFIFLFVLIYGIQALVLFIYILKFGVPGFKINWKIITELKLHKMLAYGLTLSLATIASLGLKNFDSILLAKYLPLSLVGVYAIAAFIPSVIETPLYSMEKISNAKISFALAAKNYVEIQEIYSKSSRYMLLVGGFLFLLINTNIDSLLAFLPDVYQSGKWVIMIMSLGALINMATGTNNAIIYNSENYKIGAILLVFLAGSAFGLNLILIPMWDINGAALATAISSFLFNSIKFFFIKIKFNLQPFDNKTISIIFIIAFCYIVRMFIPNHSNPFINLCLQSIIVIALYVGGIKYFKVVPEFFAGLYSLKKEFKKLY